VSTRIAALLLEPFALWHAEREHGLALPLAVTDAGRVRHASAAARAGGVQPGMRVSGALSRVPELHAVPLSAPALEAAWAEVCAGLPAYSPRLEVGGVGRALLTLTPAGAAELASALHARVGLADTRELALLAALGAGAGGVRAVADPAAFRRSLPLEALRGVGLSAELHTRLTWLGVGTVGELLRWSKGQQAAYLGAEWTVLKPYLHGANNGGVGRARLPAEVRVARQFDDPLFEPRDLSAAAQALCPALLEALAGRSPQRLTVRAGVAGLTLSATRTVKEDLRAPGVLHRAVLRALDDANAAHLGVEALEVVLSGLDRLGGQNDLWSRAAARDAAELAERRFPGVMRQVQWLDPFSVAAGTAYRWVSALTRDAPAPAPVASVRRAPVAVRA
jgi:protein ImuB